MLFFTPLLKVEVLIKMVQYKNSFLSDIVHCFLCIALYIIKLFKKKSRSIVSAKKIEYFIDGMRRPREEAIETVDVILIAGYLQPTRFVDRNYIFWCTLINKSIQWVWPHFSFTFIIFKKRYGSCNY